MPANQEELKVFISYSRKDLEFVDRLQASLKEQGVHAYVDREDIHKGEEWWARIKQLIAEADTIVFVISPDAVTSKVAQDEVDYAESLNKRFVPIVARNLEGEKVPDALARLNYIFFTPNPQVGASGDFGEALTELVVTLETDISWIREHTRLGVLAQRWEARGNSGSLVLRGDELSSAESWLGSRPLKAPKSYEYSTNVYYPKS